MLILIDFFNQRVGNFFTATTEFEQPVATEIELPELLFVQMLALADKPVFIEVFANKVSGKLFILLGLYVLGGYATMLKRIE